MVMCFTTQTKYCEIRDESIGSVPQHTLFWLDQQNVLSRRDFYEHYSESIKSARFLIKKFRENKTGLVFRFRKKAQKIQDIVSPSNTETEKCSGASDGRSFNAYIPHVGMTRSNESAAFLPISLGKKQQQHYSVLEVSEDTAITSNNMRRKCKLYSWWKIRDPLHHPCLQRGTYLNKIWLEFEHDKIIKL